MKTRDPVITEQYNQQGFGAGGLRPLFFSHLSNNWSLKPSPSNLKNASSASHSNGGEELEHYRPGVGLAEIAPVQKDIPVSPVAGPSCSEAESQEVLAEGLREEGEGEGEDREPPRKKRRVLVSSSEMRPHQGGRGWKRVVSRKKTGMRIEC